MEMNKSTTKYRNFKDISTTEKVCNKCGFATFCLRILYSHKYKCQGKLLGSLICCHCKRKFTYLSLFRQHKQTCVKSIERIKTFLRNKSKKIIHEKVRKSSKKRHTEKKASTIVCPVCMKLFTSRQLYDQHERKGSCISKKPKEQALSARKSFPKARNRKEILDFNNYLSDDDFPKIQSVSFTMPTKNPMKNNSKTDDSRIICEWCKNTYPTKSILLQHLEKNFQCAEAYYHQNYATKESHSARKSLQSVVARKSFSRFNERSNASTSSSFNSHVSGSARKSLQNSPVQKFVKSPLSSPLKSLNQCPVCYAKFPDSFNFFQHQKKLNHWGKATKSTSTFCKCPFCSKQFYHVRARNAHLRNHADKSEAIINLFLKNSTCSICSQIFVSEMVKHQHMKIAHRKPAPPSRSKIFQVQRSDSSIQCKFCPLKFKSGESLESHMQDAHYDSFTFECLVCQVNLANASHIVAHVTQVHSGENPNNIIQCRVNKSIYDKGLDRASESVKNDESTLNQVQSEEFFCDICGISFLRLAGLQSHKQSKSHQDMMVKNLDDMHKSVSELPLSRQPASKKPVQQPEILTCSECLKEYTSVKDFVPHRLSHFGVRGKYLKINELNLYTCEICREVLDSHSKVQLHLFWHLQVESTSEKKSAKANGKNDPIVPDRLTGQHVAKKSFGKQAPESQQEVVIGGVKKPLFTCVFCSIGFTTQAHHNLHVRRFCRMKNATPKNVPVEEPAEIHEDSVDESSQPVSTIVENSVSPEKQAESSDEDPIVQSDPPSESKEMPEEASNTINIGHCTLCNCLFLSSAEENHRNFCKQCKDTSELDENVEELISKLTLQNNVAACVKCSLLFDNPQLFSAHMLSLHKSKEDSALIEETRKSEMDICDDIVHCSTCNCVFFSSEALENHDSFCSNTSFCDFDIESNTDILKICMEVECPMAACVTCSMAFQSTQHLKEHMLQHTDKNSDDINTLSSADKNTEPSADTLSCTVSSLTDIPTVKDDSDVDCSMHETEEASTTEKLSDLATSLTNDVSMEEVDGTKSSQHSDVSMATVSHPQENGMPDDPIYPLRENFSQLLCILINDTELMQQLGYGEQLVDDVLVNVLQQMGQTPILKEGDISDIDCLRKNIQMLLDFILKDQVMELIASGKTSTDDIVLEALKTFSNEANAIVIAE